MWLFIVVFAVSGIIGIVSPRTSWNLSNWWKFQGNAEPKKEALILYRVSGVIMLLVAIILIGK